MQTIGSGKQKHRLIAYDLETSRIQSGTPSVLYLTAYGDKNSTGNSAQHYHLSVPITGQDKKKAFCKILEEQLLIKSNNHARFIAWNGNKFDVYFIAEALLESDRWHLQPYLTSSKSLRGLRVVEIRIAGMSTRHRLLSFEFLDGMAMTGISVPLGDKEVTQESGKMKVRKGFLSTFAPEYAKLKGPDFETGEEFDAHNRDHVRYAERDSEGLYHGMKRVASIIHDLTGLELKPTVGNLAIKHLLNNLPSGVELKRPHDDVLAVLYGPLKKGGYCWAARQYHGPVWKYDLNQAYAAAMRDAALPCGDMVLCNTHEPGRPGIYQVELSRLKKTKIPFYYKDENNVGRFSMGSPLTCWVTSIEVDHLIRDGWLVNVLTGHYWTGSFNLEHHVNQLEKLRSTDKDGPAGPLGTMVKALGNNAYGKTLEQVWDDELIFAKTQPEGYTLYDPFNIDMKYVYARKRVSLPKKYHVPQIGVFITAHVRVLVRDAALYMPDNFLYADTDCVVFDRKARHLHIDPMRYGSWKIESAGEEHIIIGKKVTWRENGGATAKGLIVKNLSKKDMLEWLAGKIPVQIQTQRNNILKFLSGGDMFTLLSRKGTDVSKLKTVRVLHGEFISR